MVKIIHSPATQLVFQNDDRLSIYRQFAEAMTRGDFNGDIPTGNEKNWPTRKVIKKAVNLPSATSRA